MLKVNARIILIIANKVKFKNIIFFTPGKKNMTNNSWESLKEDDDYEICTKYPYQIRRKSDQYIIAENIKDDGYIRCKLNRNDYYKHRLIAIQWIPNPDNLPEVDHINHIRDDNHLENLRWVTHSTNDKNRIIATANTNIKYEYFDKIDDDAIDISDYGKHEFEFYYYVEKEDSFYFYNGKQYRKLHVNIDKRSGSCFVCMNDINNKRVCVYVNKFKKLYGIDF